MQFYDQTAQEVLTALEVDAQTGLDEAGIAKNREKYGSNQLTKAPEPSLFKRFLVALGEPMVLILIAAAVITLGVNIAKQIMGQPTEFIECVGIFIAIILSVSITLIMEGRSKKAFDALNKIKDNILVKVIRDGKTTLIPQNELVVGDIVLFETGDKLPADCRLLATKGLTVDESALTGESMPVNKDADAVLDAATPLAERKNMLYAGCYVQIGQGTAVVTSVGDNTEFGKIAKELGSEKAETTPLQEKLTHLSKVIAVIGVALAVVVFLVQFVRLWQQSGINFDSVSEIFITSIVLIVASVPEGLSTIVTIALALNIIKMAKENALVKKLVACETIGCTNVICSDKTGTLTENKMTVTDLYQNGACIAPGELSDPMLVQNICINSTAEPDGAKFIGNPTECALLNAYMQTGAEKTYHQMREEATVLQVYPFASATKNMTTVVKTADGCMAYSKGSPEKILSICTGADEETIMEQIAAFQAKSMRILAFCHKEVAETDSREAIETGMIFDGFAAIKDPVRKEVFAAVDTCKKAGISIKMLTGDNVVTAKAIAEELALLDEDSLVCTAAEIEAMDDAALEEVIDRIRVIARSTPATKLRVVNMLKKRGNVVAVTGDGVNDAPAIKNADVGIAMGITGTEVSKEAADIVLLDDSFSTIVTSVHWGRGIYENFQRFIQFQLTVNLAAVVTVLASILMGFAAPFSALQLLWINIIMDGPPALALGLEPIRKDLMERKPTRRNASIVTGSMLVRILLNGLYVTVFFLLQQSMNFLQIPTVQSGGALFTMFVLFQLFNAFNCRELGHRFTLGGFFRNKTMLAIVAATFVLQIIISQFGGAFFGIEPLSLLTWAKVILSAFSVVLFSDLCKLIGRIIRK